MTINGTRLAALILALLAVDDVAMAQRGGRGGGGGGRGGMVGGGGGGGFHGGGGGGNFNRPTGNQNFNRPTTGNQNFNRPTNVNTNVNRPTNINQNFNRPTNVNTNVNRPTNINQNNLNRQNFNQNNTNISNRQNINNSTNISNRQNVVNNNISVNNVTNNRVNNNVGSFNRGGYGGYGVGNGGYGAGGRNWGYGGYGGGYHANSYYGYHSNWVNGSWGGNYRPGWGGYYPGYGGYGGNGGYGYGFGNSALGIGAGIGIAAWGVGSLVNSWGYSQYSNPYYSSAYSQPLAAVSQSVGYDYSRPLDLASAPPDETVLQTAEASLETAREAFRAGDYVQALAQADQALRQTPNDPMLHEFRATSLFAMRRYDEAAVPFYTVLSAGPGWDWTTLIGLYPDVETYTSQLRALESYCNANARAGSARFVLASLYLTQGSTAAATTRLREVVAIQPQDKLSAQLLAAITSATQPSQGQPQDQPALAQAQPVGNDAAPAEPAPAAQAPPLPTGPVPANLTGSWSASPAKDVTISLSIPDDKSFSWKVVEKGQTREFKGEAHFDNDILALVPPDMPPMVAKVTGKDGNHFNFKAVGTPSEDPGLNFVK